VTHGIVSYYTWTVPKRIHRAMTSVATPDERIGQPAFISLLPEHLQEPTRRRLSEAPVPVDRMGRQRQRWTVGTVSFVLTTVVVLSLWAVAKLTGTVSLPPLTIFLPLTLAGSLLVGVHAATGGYGLYTSAWLEYRFVKGKPGNIAIRRDVISMHQAFWYYPGQLLILNPMTTIPRRSIAGCTLHPTALDGRSFHLLAIEKPGDPIRDLIAVDPAESIEELKRFMADCGYPIRDGEPIELRGAEA
jgi:hypothetical protein